MIKQVEMYTLICDICGKDVCSDADYSCWNDKEYLKDIAREDLWLVDTVDDAHYCPDCYEYDEEDNLIIKSEEIRQKFTT